MKLAGILLLDMIVDVSKLSTQSDSMVFIQDAVDLEASVTDGASVMKGLGVLWKSNIRSVLVMHCI